MCFFPVIRPIYRKDGRYDGCVITKCGKCVECLKDRQRDWRFRLSFEFNRPGQYTYLVTLTIDNPSLFHFRSCALCSKNKEFCKDKLTPVIALQKFHKRLRKALNPVMLRYFVVSEYGERTQRLHFHCLYFTDCRLIPSKFNEIIAKKWTYGFTSCKQVSDYKGINYCTKYLVQPAVEGGWFPRIFLTSKNPAIGASTEILTKIKNNVPDLQKDTRYPVDGYRIPIPRVILSKLLDFSQRQNRKRAANRLAEDAAREFFHAHGLNGYTPLSSASGIITYEQYIALKYLNDSKINKYKVPVPIAIVPVNSHFTYFPLNKFKHE